MYKHAHLRKTMEKIHIYNVYIYMRFQETVFYLPTYYHTPAETKNWSKA